MFVRFRSNKVKKNIFTYFWIMTKTVLVGAGHLAFHFQNQLTKSKKFQLIQWYSRSIEKVTFSQKKLDITDQLYQLKEADLYLICVSDDAIASVSKKIETEGLVAHCAGGVPLDRLKGPSKKAVFYPLQTFTKGADLSFEQLPFCIETTASSDQKILQDLAEELGGTAHKIDSQKRAMIHLIAVFLNNFGNHLLHLGNDLAKKNNIPFEIFHPLIHETFAKALSNGPKNAQTGPALRHDQKTIDKHLSLLDDKDIKKLYIHLTSSIQKKHEQ
jgi:predicted short-subunit dehydrogenase-like oxidoreductase (DUF2520 family)